MSLGCYFFSIAKYSSSHLFNVVLRRVFWVAWKKKAFLPRFQGVAQAHLNWFSTEKTQHWRRKRAFGCVCVCMCGKWLVYTVVASAHRESPLENCAETGGESRHRIDDETTEWDGDKGRISMPLIPSNDVMTLTPLFLKAPLSQRHTINCTCARGSKEVCRAYITPWVCVCMRGFIFFHLE